MLFITHFLLLVNKFSLKFQNNQYCWLLKQKKEIKIVFELFFTKIKYEMSTKITNDEGYISFLLIFIEFGGGE